MKALLSAIWIFIPVAAFFGWCMNIMTLIKDAPELAHWGGFEVMRAIGVVVPPIGAILGWF